MTAKMCDQEKQLYWLIQSQPFIINHPVCIMCLQSKENVCNPEATSCNRGLIGSGIYNNSWPTYFKWCNRACDSLICTNKMPQYNHFFAITNRECDHPSSLFFITALFFVLHVIMFMWYCLWTSDTAVVIYSLSIVGSWQAWLTLPSVVSI